MADELRPEYELYFAYGSNMLEQRLKDRMGSAEFFSNAWIRSYEVRFRKKSDDGSGKADLVQTGNPGDIVHGVVYQFDPNERDALNAAEPGYDPETIEVQNTTGVLKATTYLAREDQIDESLKPYTWYRDVILCGAEQHGIPEDYRQKIERILDLPDPKPTRDARKTAERQIREYRESIGRGQ
jgi:gamma-glutamylcyclotransferase (GGCT)/AIG2-like uncharacterized protein YtfP